MKLTGGLRRVQTSLTALELYIIASINLIVLEIVTDSITVTDIDCPVCPFNYYIPGLLVPQHGLLIHESC